MSQYNASSYITPRTMMVNDRNIPPRAPILDDRDANMPRMPTEVPVSQRLLKRTYIAGDTRRGSAPDITATTDLPIPQSMRTASPARVRPLSSVPLRSPPAHSLIGSNGNNGNNGVYTTPPMVRPPSSGKRVPSLPSPLDPSHLPRPLIKRDGALAADQHLYVPSFSPSVAPSVTIDPHLRSPSPSLMAGSPLPAVSFHHSHLPSPSFHPVRASSTHGSASPQPSPTSAANGGGAIPPSFAASHYSPLGTLSGHSSNGSNGGNGHLPFPLPLPILPVPSPPPLLSIPSHPSGSPHGHLNTTHGIHNMSPYPPPHPPAGSPPHNAPAAAISPHHQQHHGVPPPFPPHPSSYVRRGPIGAIGSGGHLNGDEIAWERERHHLVTQWLEWAKNRPGVRPPGHDGRDMIPPPLPPNNMMDPHPPTNGGGAGHDTAHWAMHGPEHTFDIKGNAIRSSHNGNGTSQHDGWMTTINGRPSSNNITINISPGTVKRGRGGNGHMDHSDDNHGNDDGDEPASSSQPTSARGGRAGRRTRARNHVNDTNSGSDVASGDDRSGGGGSSRGSRAGSRSRTALEIARRSGNHNKSAPPSTSTSPTRNGSGGSSRSNANKPGGSSSSSSRRTHSRHRSADDDYDGNMNGSRASTHDNAPQPRGLSLITNSGSSGDGYRDHNDHDTNTNKTATSDLIPSRVPFSIVSPIPERGKRLATSNSGGSNTKKSSAGMDSNGNGNEGSSRRLRSRSASRTRNAKSTKGDTHGTNRGRNNNNNNGNGNGVDDEDDDGDGTGDEYDANGRLLPRHDPPNALYIGRRRNSDDMHREHPSLPPYLQDVRWDGEMYHSLPKKGKNSKGKGVTADEKDEAAARREQQRKQADQKRTEFIAEYTKRLRALKGNSSGDDDEATKQQIQAEVDKWQAAQDEAEHKAKKAARRASRKQRDADTIDDEVDNDDALEDDDDDYNGRDRPDDQYDDDDEDVSGRRRRMQRQRSADSASLPPSSTLLSSQRSAPPVLGSGSGSKKANGSSSSSSRRRTGDRSTDGDRDTDKHGSGGGADGNHANDGTGDDARSSSRRSGKNKPRVPADERISLHRNPYSGGFDREDHSDDDGRKGDASQDNTNNGDSHSRRSTRSSPDAITRTLDSLGRRQEPFWAISKSPTSRPATAATSSSFDPSAASSPNSGGSHGNNGSGHGNDTSSGHNTGTSNKDDHSHGHHSHHHHDHVPTPMIPLSNGELLLTKQPKANFDGVGIRTAQAAYHPDFNAHWTPPVEPLLSPQPPAGTTVSTASPVPPSSSSVSPPLSSPNTGSNSIGHGHGDRPSKNAHAHFADNLITDGKNRATRSLQGSPASSPDGPTYHLLAAAGTGKLHGMTGVDGEIIIRDEDDDIGGGNDDDDTPDGERKGGKPRRIITDSRNSSRGAPSWSATTTPGTTIGDRPAIWPPRDPATSNGLPTSTDNEDQLVAAVMAYLKRPECVLLPHTADGTGVLIGGVDANGDELLLNGDSARLLIEDGQTGGLTLHYLQHLQDQSRNFDSLENLVIALSEMVGTLQEKNDVFSKLNNPYSTLLDPSVTFNMSDVDRLFFESKAGPDTLVHLDDMIREGRRFDTFDGLVEAVQSQQMDAFQRRKVLVEFLSSQNGAGNTPLNESDLDQLYDEGRELSAALRQLAQGEHEKAILQYLRHPTTNLLTPSVEETLTIVDMRQFFGPGLPGEHTLKYLKDLARDKVTYHTFPDLVTAVKNAHRDHNDKLKKAKAQVWTYLTDPKPGSLFGRHQTTVQPTITHTQVDALFDKGGAGLDTLKTLRLLKRARRMGSGGHNRHGAATPGGSSTSEDNGFRSMAELTSAVRAVTAIEQERQRVFQFLTSPECKLFEVVPPPLSVRTDSSLFLSDSGTGGAMGSGTAGTTSSSSHHSPVSTTRIITDGTDGKRESIHTPVGRHTLGGGGTVPHTPAGTHHLHLSPALTSMATPSSPLTPQTPSPTDTKSNMSNEESDVLGALRDKENMEIIAKQIRERFGPRLASSSSSSRDSSVGGTAPSSRRPSQHRSATLMGTSSPGSTKSTLASRSPNGLQVSTGSQSGRFASFSNNDRKHGGGHIRSPSASPPLSPSHHPHQPVVVRMENVESLFAELAADQHQRISDGLTRDRGPVYPRVYGWLHDFNDASRKFTRFPDLVRALKDRAAGMDDSECEVAPTQMGPGGPGTLSRSSSNLETLMEGGVNVMPTLVKVLEEIIESNDEDNEDGSGNTNRMNDDGRGDDDPTAMNTNADGTMTAEEKARHDAEQQAEQMDEEAKTMAHLQSLLPELFVTPAKITVDNNDVTKVIAASGGLPHAARFYLSQLAADCTASAAAKAAGRPFPENDDQPQFENMDGLIQAISDAHDAAKAVKNEMFDFLTTGAGSGLVTQTFGVVPKLSDMDRLYEDGGAGNDTLIALQTLADAGLEFGFLGELGAAIKAAHVGTQRQQAADKQAMMAFFKDRGGQALLPSLPPVTMTDIDTLYRDAEAGNETVERMEPLLTAHRTFDTITALADAVRNPDVDARRAQVEAQAAQHERDKKEVLDYLQGPDCQLFMDAPDKVNVGIRDVDALFYEGGAGSSTITFVKAFDFADKRFERFPQLITAVAAAHRGKRVKQQQQQNKKAGNTNDPVRIPTVVVGDPSQQALSVLPAIVAALQERAQQALGRPRKFGRTHSLGEDDGVTDVTQLPGYEKYNGPHASGVAGSGSSKDDSPSIPGLERSKSHRRTQSSVPAGASSRPVSPTLRAMASAAAAAAANLPPAPLTTSPTKDGNNGGSGKVTTSAGSSPSLNSSGAGVLPPPSTLPSSGSSPAGTTRQLRRPPALDVNSSNVSPMNGMGSPTPKSPRVGGRGSTPHSGGLGQRDSLAAPTNMASSPSGAKHSRSIGRWQGLSRPVVSSSAQRDEAEAENLLVAASSPGASSRPFSANPHSNNNGSNGQADETSQSLDGLRPKSGVRRGSIADQRPESAASAHDGSDPSQQRRGSSVTGMRGGVSFAPDTPLSRPSRGLIRARARSLAMNSLDPNAGNQPMTPGGGGSHAHGGGAGSVSTSAHARRLDAAAAAYAASVAAGSTGQQPLPVTGTTTSNTNNNSGAGSNDMARVNNAHAALMQAANSSSTSSSMDTSKAAAAASTAGNTTSMASSSSSSLLHAASEPSGPFFLPGSSLAASSSSSSASSSSSSGPSRAAPSAPMRIGGGGSGSGNSNDTTSSSSSSLSVSSGVTMTTPQTGSSSSMMSSTASSSTSSAATTATASSSLSSSLSSTSNNNKTGAVVDANGSVVIGTGNTIANDAQTGGITGTNGNRGPSRAPVPPSTTAVVGASSAGSLTTDNTGAMISHGAVMTASSTIVTPQSSTSTTSPNGSSSSSSSAASTTTTTAAHRGPSSRAPSPPPETLVTMSTGVATSSVAQQGTIINRKPVPPPAKTGEEKKRPTAVQRPVVINNNNRRWALLRKHVRGGAYRKKRPAPPPRQEVLEPQLEPTFRTPGESKDNGTYENDPDKEFVHFNIECDNLDKVYVLTSTDSCVRISCSRQHIWELVHQTPIIRDNVNPRWPSLILPVNRICYGEYERPLKIEVVHMYNDGTPPKFLARLETTLKMMILSKGKPFDLINVEKQKQRGYVNSGTIRFNDPGIWINTTMTVVKSVSSRLFDTESQCFLRMKLKAEGLPKRNILSTPDPFIQFYRLRKGKELRAREAKDRKEEKEVDERWELVHSTDVISSSQNPSWDLIVKVHTLAFGEYNRPVLIQMMDKSGKDGRLIGSFEVTIKSLCAKQSKELYPLIHHEKKKKDGAKYNHSGILTCNSAMVFTRAYKRKEVVDKHGRHAVLTSNPLGLRKTVIGYMKALAQEHEKRGRVAPIATGAQNHLSDLHFSSLAEKALLVDRTGILNSRANSRPGSRANSRPSSPSRQDQQGRGTPTGLMSVSSFTGTTGGAGGGDLRSHRSAQPSVSMARYPSGTGLIGAGDMTTRSVRHSRDSSSIGGLQPQPPSSSRRHRDRDDNRSTMTPTSATFSGNTGTPTGGAPSSSTRDRSARRSRRATGERGFLATSPTSNNNNGHDSSFARTSSAI